MSKKVFISYAHESKEFQDRILSFSNDLRSKGIDAELDQYEENPIEGWPKWMANQIEKSDFVLIICTKNFLDRYNDITTDKGHGVRWETNHIIQLLYESKLNAKKFLPVIFKHEDSKHIPLPLRAYTYYNLSENDRFERLVKLLQGKPTTYKPPLGKPEEQYKPLEIKKRKTLFIVNFFNVDLWNEAHWNGIGFYKALNQDSPPILCFQFKNSTIGDQIFKELKNRFGIKDKRNEIRISIIANVSDENPEHIILHISSDWNVFVDNIGIDHPILDSSDIGILSKQLLVTPPLNYKGLEMFKNDFEKHKKYYISNLSEMNGKWTPNLENVIEKSKIYFRTKDEILNNENDEDAVVFAESITL